MNVIHYTWEQFERDSRVWLSVIDFSNYDLLIGLARGGLPLLTKFANQTKKPYGVIKCHSYEGQTRKQLHLDSFPSGILNQRILLIDDIADTGETLKAVSEELYRRGASSVETLCLFYKPQSVVEPTWYKDEILNEQWVSFAWE